MTIHIVTKSRNELKIKCKEFTVKKNAITGRMETFEISGMKGNYLLEIDMNNIDFIYEEKK